MGVDLQALDAKIRRLQKLRELLSDDDTRELLSDPETVALIQESRNGNGTRPTAKTADDEDSRENAGDDDGSIPSEGSFRRKVWDIVRSSSSRFDARYVREKLRVANHQYDADNPMIAINTALRALQRKGLVRLVRAGSGRRPHIYEAVQKGEPQK